MTVIRKNRLFCLVNFQVHFICQINNKKASKSFPRFFT